MKDLIQNKINQLSEEAHELIKDREEMVRQIEDINVRLHQIAGAITEFHGILNQDSLNKDIVDET